MTTLARQIVDAIMAGKDSQANKLFEVSMAKSVKTQLEDYKTALAKKLFEEAGAVDNSFIPVKHDYTIHAVDTGKKSDRLPEGEPIQYKVNAYSPKTAFKVAAQNGHSIEKVVDSSGVDVTDEAKKGINEGTETGAVDADYTAQQIAMKQQEQQERAQEETKSKAPTINDVVGVLGNTVSVIDAKSVQ